MGSFFMESEAAYVLLLKDSIVVDKKKPYSSNIDGLRQKDCAILLLRGTTSCASTEPYGIRINRLNGSK